MEVHFSNVVPTSTTGSLDKQNTPTSSSPTELSNDEKQVISKLQARDRSVKAHEQAHVAAGGNLITSSPSYTYQKGPDGVNYAIGGEVKIDTSEEKDPQATLEKAEQIRRAALAPAQPSAQDRAIAAKAVQLAVEARAELAQQKADSSSTAGTNNFVIDSPDSGELVDLTV